MKTSRFRSVTAFVANAALLFGCAGPAAEPLATAELVHTDAIPCAPRAVLERVCQQCHSSPPRGGAPFPLVSYDDVTRERDGSPMYEHMRRAIEAERMPLSPAVLEAADRDTLVAWLAAGAPGAPAAQGDGGPDATCR